MARNAVVRKINAPFQIIGGAEQAVAFRRPEIFSIENDGKGRIRGLCVFAFDNFWWDTDVDRHGPRTCVLCSSSQPCSLKDINFHNEHYHRSKRDAVVKIAARLSAAQAGGRVGCFQWL